MSKVKKQTHIEQRHSFQYLIKFFDYIKGFFNLIREVTAIVLL